MTVPINHRAGASRLFSCFLFLIIFGHKICHVIFESVVQNTFADFIADVDDKMFIVDASEGFAGDLVDLVEMM